MKLKHLLLAVLMGFTSMYANADKISLIADIHVNPGNHREEKLKQVINDINNNDTELVVLAGDLTDEGSDEQLKNVKSILDLIKKPLFVIPGNHENNWSQSACKTFFDIWGNDRFVTETENLIIVGINCGPYMKMGDGHVKHEDLLWLDKTLSERVKKGKKVISVCHYALNADLDSYREYVEILKKYPVVAHLNGHYHQYKKYRVENIEVLHCRSMEMGKKPDFGYSIVDVTTDSVKVFNKVKNESAELKFAYKIDHKTIVPIEKGENFNTELPENFKVELAHRDDASIFTRVGLDDENIYIGNSLGYIKSINKKSGKVNWTYKTQASLFSRPAVAKNVVIVPTADKRLLWIDKKTGNVVNEKNANGPYVADGIILGNTLYQGGYKVFQAWDIKSATLKWELNDLKNYCQAAPATYKNDIV
ncbi:MAG: metallophosphoesterase, partial [Muribaculaceae bacterium]|nr:metallophosphoesterase [Muribaculaceae bacterium]